MTTYAEQGARPSSYATQIREASNLLTEETWHKGSYFTEKNGKICMCAHGAMQAVCNPKVRKAMAQASVGGLAEGAVAANREAEVAAVVEVAVATAGAEGAGVCDDYRYAWDIRSNWFRTTISEPHYLMGLVGLTFSFNDGPSTLVEVKEKFEEAAQLAERLGV